MAIRGAVIGIEVMWNCNLDWDFMTYCLPKYQFHILDESGWNFRHAIYHEEHRRTLIKAYGMKFLINVNGIAGKFDVTRTIVIIVTGLGLMGLTNILCDFMLLKSSNKYREAVAEKKYEKVQSDPHEDVVMQGVRNLMQKQKRRNTEYGIAGMMGNAGMTSMCMVAVASGNRPSESSSPAPTQSSTKTENTPDLTRHVSIRSAPVEIGQG